MPPKNLWRYRQDGLDGYFRYRQSDRRSVRELRFYSGEGVAHDHLLVLCDVEQLAEEFPDREPDGPTDHEKQIEDVRAARDWYRRKGWSDTAEERLEWLREQSRERA